MTSQACSFKEGNLEHIPALAMFKKTVAGKIRIFVSGTEAKVDRKAQNGLYLFTGLVEGQQYAFACSDFRVNGGSFGKENSQRFLAFLAECQAMKLPLVFFINSMGVSLFEGRTVFSNAFALVPALETYKKTASLYTVSLKNVFGLAALLFGLGTYRIALHQQSFISLAGPMVFRLFFGDKGNFNALSQVNQDIRTGSLIHEICYSPEHALSRVIAINNVLQKNNTGSPAKMITVSTIYNKNIRSKALIAAHIKAVNVVSGFADEGLEIFPNFDHKLKVFLCKIDGKLAGVLINPLGFHDNMLGANTLDLYLEALAFFKANHLPAISILDTPGTDPGMEQGNYLIIEKMLALSKSVIEYPYLKIGIVAGRAYGGATVTGFPKVFGGHANLAFRNADIGAMKPGIIDTLLSASDKMLEHWKRMQLTMDANLQDLIDCGTIDNVIEEQELKSHLVRLLSGS